MICTCEQHESHDLCKQSSSLFVCACFPVLAAWLEGEAARLRAELKAACDQRDELLTKIENFKSGAIEALDTGRATARLFEGGEK